MTLRHRAREIPVALRVAILYLLARLITTGFIALAAGLSGPASRFGADATVSELLMGWDAQWYWSIVTQGYPTDLPVDLAGDVQQNQWAFMPVYPVLANLVGLPLGSYAAGAFLVPVVAGYLACLVLYRLLRDRLDETATMWAVLLFAAGPLAAMFHLGYAEALFLLWLFLALRCLQRRRFGWLYLLIPLMGYTRPGVLAFALLLGLYGIWRWFRRRRDPLPVREIVHIIALGLIAVIVGFSWQVIAGIVTGDMSAYLDTELSWRRGWLSAEESGFVPFAGFVQAAGMWFRLWGMPSALGYAALAVCVGAVAWLLLSERHVRRLGVVVRLWSASYIVYLLAVFFPQSSIFRLLLPLSPLYGALAAPRSTWWRVAMLVLGLAGQWWWIYSMLAQGNAYTQIP
ncbi:hypothetical protein GCM10022382_22480 [Microbacterium invictum]